jgi:predicted dehydrogenase
MTPLAIAVIGACGLIGKRHCKHVKESKNAYLCAIVDPGSQAHELADQLRTVAYPTLEQLLNSPRRPVAAIVCTPNHTHAPLSIQLARAGVHVLCEKPIASNSQEAQEIIVAAQASGVHLLIGHHRRFNPYLLALKKIVDNGELGHIIAVNGLWTTTKPSEYFSGLNAWRSGENGGVVLINLIHDLDLLQYMLGPVATVQAEEVISQRSSEKGSVEEGAAILFKFESGVVGSFIVADNVASPHSFEQGTGENPNLPYTGADVYRVFGSKGTISFPDMTLSSYRDGPVSWNVPMSSVRLSVPDKELEPLALQLEHFIRVCQGKEPPNCSGGDGMRALAACEAVKQAMKEKISVNVMAPHASRL